MEITVLKEENIPQTIEFKVQDDFVKKLPEILSNVAQIKQWAIERTEEDRNLVLVSDEDFEIGKKRCAEINKVIQNIDAKRKDVKKRYNEPYEIFEKSLKEVLDVLKTAKDNLWGQVTAAEEKAKADKEAELKAYYEGLNCKWRTWKQVFDKTWLNKGKKIDAVKEEIDRIVEATNNDIKIIESLNSEYEVALKVRYTDGYGLGEVVSYNTQLTSQHKRDEAEKGQGVANTQPTQQMPVETATIEQKTEEELIVIDFRVQCTVSQLSELGKYMKAHGIKYSKIKE